MNAAPDCWEEVAGNPFRQSMSRVLERAEHFHRDCGITSRV